MSTKPTKLLLVDGNALLYRAFHAFPPDLTTSKGELINAVFGFTRILLATIRDLKPEQAAVCFDLKGPTFRSQAFEQYKANRQAMPEELASQIPRAHQVVEFLELPIYALEGYEADDCIGTISKQAVASDPNLKVIILTGDQDMMQLVSDQINVLKPGSPPKPSVLFDPAMVKEYYGFEPIQMIDYKGLRGDPSDNIPGVPGIGEVTAKQLIALFGSVEGTYEAIEAGKTDGVKPGVLKKLQEHKDMAFLSKQIATIDSAVPVTYNAETCKLDLKAPDRLVALFNELGFKSLMQFLPKSHKMLSEAADVFDATATEQPDAPLVIGEPSESEKVDEEIAPILRKMEEHGVLIDKKYLQKLQEEFNEEIATVRDALMDAAGQPFNPDSPSQVGHILYEVMKIPTTNISKGKTGYTTDAATLQKLAEEHPIAQSLLRYREITKLQRTYVLPLQEIADEKSRIHTSYAPDTATGRISSRDPNLQNIPTRSEDGKRIRQAFIPSPGMTLVGADYSQMELRVAAHLSGDKAMQELFNKGSDFHAETAAKMGVDRRVAKIINFSILYGKGAFGFAVDLGITVAEAKEYIEQYFATFPQLRVYLDKVVAEAKERGYTETMLGRRRYLPELRSANFNHRAAAEREAFNHPIQGSQADILKLAMRNLAPKLPDGAHLILTVHDELVLEVKDAQVKAAAKVLEDAMVHAVELVVPIQVNLKTGENWASMEAYDPAA